MGIFLDNFSVGDRSLKAYFKYSYGELTKIFKLLIRKQKLQ